MTVHHQESAGEEEDGFVRKFLWQNLPFAPQAPFLQERVTGDSSALKTSLRIERVREGCSTRPLREPPLLGTQQTEI